ncbi:membrane protein [Vibrio orientalis CIP 102891 = ATCC 33934]|uniref:Activity regulator of membrane protease YbbK n=1 Tax=Vibrio orientalis CIP 102891 = ATCC 33934 TaxID=675816 RepID=C9QM12_VIBOR|nr:NfeD family protein [Vibrio orientalis]EEX93029.1 putative activity regulator of membrane protease YbbK [Vibrio orientalis CIP 102891 = ATCC 33934]EGU50648.1 membrane protein [Vibrio orientalis CIP 102891 = ATCC 33934]
MIELLDSLNHWHWLAFGLALLALELLGTAGYFLWLGLSALIVGALLLAMPMSWQLQWVSFAVFSLATTWLWWRKQFKQDKQSDAHRELNQKHKQLIGQSVRLDHDFPAGKGRIKLGDSTWTAQSDVDLEANTLVEITSVEGIILTISKKS